MFHGLRVGGRVAYSVVALKPNSGIVVLPSTVNPADRNCSVNGACAAAGRALTASEPWSDGSPAKSVLSLTNVGTPAKTPVGGMLGRREAAVEVGMLDRVELGVHPLRTGDRRLGGFAGADGSRGNSSGDPDSVEVAECVIAEGVYASVFSVVTR